MIVVADAGSIHYLARIEAIDVVAALYKRVLVPQTVAQELQHNNTPSVVRAWIAQPPAWFEVRPDPPDDPGERAAIELVQSLRVSVRHPLLNRASNSEASLRSPSSFGSRRCRYSR